MTSGVIYLLTGPAHGIRLVVSLWSLRRHYDGPITVYTTHPVSHHIGELCQQDLRLRVEHRRTSSVELPKNSSFLTKLEILPSVPYDVAVYLDADTLVTGCIQPLLDSAKESGFAATQFANWTSSGRVVRKRIEAWREVKQSHFDNHWLQQLIDEALESRPAVNGGVFGFRQNAEILSTWRDLSYAGWETFICDEIALQLLLPRFPHQVLDCRFNCSPVFAGSHKDVRIWHFHGEKHLNREEARQLWWPAYCICVAENIAGLTGWTPGDDRRLAGFLRTKHKKNGLNKGQ